MTEPGPAADDATDGARPNPEVERIVRRAEVIGGLPVVRELRAVVDLFGSAGGGLLAGGLAYAALFAIIPALVLVIGLAGFVLRDPLREAQLVDSIGSALPPLQPLAADVVDGVGQGASVTSVVGLVGLVWGASRFYGALDDAFARIFRDAPVRGLVARIVRGLISVALLIGVLLAAIALTGLASALVDQRILGDAFGQGARDALQVGAPAVAAIAFVAGAAFAYRVVPDRRVAWRAIAVPAVLVGFVLAVFTQLFTLLAPRLVGAAAVLGSIAAVFALLAWLSTSFQVLLIGAAWVRIRAERSAHPPAETASD
jgi:membrane protein